MKPDHFERNQALASEYVVGTLQGAARKRFEHWMMESPRLRRQVWYWERRLEPFNNSLPKTEPPAQLWDQIEQRLFSEPAPLADKRGVGFWRWSALLAMASLLIMLVWTPLPEQGRQGLVAVVQSEQAQPLWVMNASAGDQHLTLKALPPVSAEAGQDYELWLLPESGVPVSLTVLPTEGAELRITLSNEQVRELLKSRSLAISLEPKGGSPTGQPTGPVVYQTQLVDM
ncbi:anti-sigma factor [Alcanivorax sp. S6407]|uniref:anti-sigma factor n=1 Tax=Alcanivorax sp. S6407 TaxID=2926424 RepID=UPI001FF4D471|nr:anti-sigma factor [Alcanivorax sp. S6407]MCK0154758.1 anti-sigma factor [Alcanivorax sp. S6407]